MSLLAGWRVASMWTCNLAPPGGKLSNIELKLSLGCHLRVHPRAKLAPATKLSSISRWIHWLDLKASSRCGKFLGKGLWGSMTEYMVVKDVWQPSIASPICWARSWRSTMARRCRGSDHKLLTPSDAFSRAAVHSDTRRVSPTKSRQVPRITGKY
jgi:hypothetical protein